MNLETEPEDPRPAVGPRTLERAEKLLKAALEYAAANIFVFPLHRAVDGSCSCGKLECKNAGKHPRTSHGLSDATTDPVVIRGWWERWRLSNIGIATGPSGLVVLDIDPRHGGDESFEQLKAMFPGNWTTTLTARSGGGGRHLYFAADPAAPGRCITNLTIAGQEFPGLDVKATGGSIVAPPSRHASGKLYCWLSACYQN